MADVQLGTQQNTELVPSLPRPLGRASDFRERRMGSLARSPQPCLWEEQGLLVRGPVE